MQQESTAVQSNSSHFFVESAEANKFLINTSKVIKGNKLKTKDFVKMQLLRFRKCSPVKYQDLYQHQQSKKCGQRHQEGGQFRKFRPFQSVEHDSIQKMVQNQRINVSRQTKGRIKLFNNTKINSMFQGQPSQKFPLKTKSNTAHNHTRQRQKYANNKTTTNESNPLSESKRQKKKKQVFRSQNLGSKMNNYLNLYLNRDRNDEDEEVRDIQRPERQSEHIQRIACDQRQSHTIDVFRKRPNMAFIRKMKKHVKSRVDSTEQELLSQFKSEQLVKPNTAFPAYKRQHPLVQSKEN